MIEKICTKCDVSKPLAEFSAQKGGKFGKQAHCRTCDRLRWKKYYSENAQAQNAKSRKWSANNLEKCKLSMRKRRKSDPVKDAAYRKYYRSRNPDRIKIHEFNKKAKRRKAVGRITLKEWMSSLIHFSHKCIYCASADRITREHFIPISRGGHNLSYNVVPACHDCNSRKTHLSCEEFISINPALAESYAQSRERIEEWALKQI